MTYNVTEFDHTAQEIDDTVSNLGGASTPQGAIAALGAGVRKNLLINPFFKVNQRGNITYTSNGYCVDNWEITYKDTGNYGVTVHDDYIVLSAGQERETRVDQFIEDADAVFGKTVTGSALLEDGTLRTGSAVFQKSSGGYTTETIYTDTTFSFLLQSGPSMNALVRLVVKEGKSVGVRAVKLEFGNTQTLAYQDDSGAWQLLEHPDPLEVLKCQRYQFTFANAMRIRASRITNSEINFFIPLPTGLRTTPTIVNAQNLQVYSPTGGAAQTGFAFSCPSGSAAFGNGVTIVATKSSHGLQDAFLYTNTPGGANLITLDANL